MKWINRSCVPLAFMRHKNQSKIKKRVRAPTLNTYDTCQCSHSLLSDPAGLSAHTSEPLMTFSNSSYVSNFQTPCGAATFVACVPLEKKKRSMPYRNDIGAFAAEEPSLPRHTSQTMSTSHRHSNDPASEPNIGSIMRIHSTRHPWIAGNKGPDPAAFTSSPHVSSMSYEQDEGQGKVS